MTPASRKALCEFLVRVKREWDEEFPPLSAPVDWSKVTKVKKNKVASNA